MQKTRFTVFYDSLNLVFLGFLKSSWKDKSFNLLSILFGYFLFANFITKFISEGKNELLMIPVIIISNMIIIMGIISNSFFPSEINFVMKLANKK